MAHELLEKIVRSMGLESAYTKSTATICRAWAVYSSSAASDLLSRAFSLKSLGYALPSSLLVRRRSSVLSVRSFPIFFSTSVSIFDDQSTASFAHTSAALPFACVRISCYTMGLDFHHRTYNGRADGSAPRFRFCCRNWFYFQLPGLSIFCLEKNITR
jgi:hypothetical protein